MVEFAFVAPVAILLLLAIIDFGFAIYTLHLVSDSARMGSRYAMVRGSTCTYTGCPATAASSGPGSIEQYVLSVSPVIDKTKLTVTTTWPQTPVNGCLPAPSPANAPGCPVSVEVNYKYSFLGFVLPNVTLNIDSTAQNVIAQ